MTVDECREFKGRMIDDRDVVLWEIAAQLAELNESLKRMAYPAQTFNAEDPADAIRNAILKVNG